MHLSSEELAEKVYERCDTAADFERWEETLLRPDSMVHRHDGSSEEEAGKCTACGGEIEFSAAPVRPEMGQHPDGCPCFFTDWGRWGGPS